MINTVKHRKFSIVFSLGLFILKFNKKIFTRILLIFTIKAKVNRPNW